MRATNKRSNGQRNTHLIVLAAVAGFVALLLFLDTWIPLIPDGKERPGRSEENATGNETHGWQNVVDHDETGKSESPVETDGEFTPIPRPTPSVQLYYTEEEMVEAYSDYLTGALVNLCNGQKHLRTASTEP